MIGYIEKNIQNIMYRIYKMHHDVLIIFNIIIVDIFQLLQNNLTRIENFVNFMIYYHDIVIA